jgi:hypothetical protein
MLLESSDCDTLCFPDLETRHLKLFHKFLFESKPAEEEVKSQSELFQLIGVKLENYLGSLGEFFCLFICLFVCLLPDEKDVKSLSVRLSVCLSVCLPACLSVCPFNWR